MPSHFIALACFARRCLALALALGAGGLTELRGQDDLDLPPPAAHKKDGVQITFLPPPMQGVLSLGIYDAQGKLVRVLHREATEKQFTIGLNGLITRWDGMTDAGEPASPARYAARGWMTGNLGIEGVAFHGNDWVQEDGPRLVEMLRLNEGPAGAWQVALRDHGGAEHLVTVASADAPVQETPAVRAIVEAGKLMAADEDRANLIVLEEGEQAMKATVGIGGNIWAIVKTPTGLEVRAYSPEGEFLRRLAYAEGEPAPFDLAASTSAHQILLLERNGREQRFRILAHAEGAAWKTIAQKRIIKSESFAEVAAELGGGEALKEVPSVKLRSKMNPLFQNKRAEAEVQLTADPSGATLRTLDGLPLLQVTDTKNLKWCVFVKDANALRIFQSDGVVVEEFKVSHPENLMAFDAGEYVLKK